jgi:transcriptional regulator with XRE-family HTH domain
MRQVTEYISIGHLSEVERGKKELSSRHLPLVARGLGIEAHELVLLAGYRMAGWDIPDTASELFDEYADLMVKSN